MPNDQPIITEEELRARPKMVLVFTILGALLFGAAFMPLIFPDEIELRPPIAAEENLGQEAPPMIPFLNLTIWAVFFLMIAIPITLLVGLYEGSYLVWLLMRSLGWIYVICFVILLLSDIVKFFSDQPEKSLMQPLGTFSGFYFTILYFWLDTEKARKFYRAVPESLRSFGIHVVDH